MLQPFPMWMFLQAHLLPPQAGHQCVCRCKREPDTSREKHMFACQDVKVSIWWIIARSFSPCQSCEPKKGQMPVRYEAQLCFIVTFPSNFCKRFWHLWHCDMEKKNVLSMLSAKKCWSRQFKCSWCREISWIGSSVYHHENFMTSARLMKLWIYARIFIQLWLTILLVGLGLRIRCLYPPAES